MYMWDASYFKGGKSVCSKFVRMQERKHDTVGSAGLGWLQFCYRGELYMFFSR